MKTALQLASYEGKLDVVKFLLENKADVNMADGEGDTALHFAAFGYVFHPVVTPRALSELKFDKHALLLSRIM